MRVKITTAVLDAMNTGQHHDLRLVTRARAILEAAGCEVEPHETELAEVEKLRRQARELDHEADVLAELYGSKS